MITGQEMLNYKTWAVVGDVLNETKFAYKIFNRLKQEGYNVFPVNPRSQKEEVYKSLGEIDEKIDVIDLVIHPKVGLNVVKEAKELGIDKIFIQPGAESEEILAYCRDNQLKFFQGCVLVELNKRKEITV